MFYRLCTCPITELLHNTNQFPSNNLNQEASIKTTVNINQQPLNRFPSILKVVGFHVSLQRSLRVFNNERLIMSKGEAGIFQKDLIVFHDSANC